jgi:DNA helicase-2/ATP-dependent DNA helicase PcrA
MLRLGERLVSDQPLRQTRIVTFTRAATAELVEKIRKDGHKVPEPTTLHAFALSLLVRHRQHVDLAVPVRIPDTWETRNLIHPDLALRLKELNFTVRVSTVQKLERELAAQWESLDPTIELLADLEPALRNAYLALWQMHRNIFGYALFAEIPFRAYHLIEDHPDAVPQGLKVLIIDEFQDLNASDINLSLALARRRVSILAFGDDDQSIYSFRMADPAGIRHLSESLPELIDYPLSKSLRCGVKILHAATTLIEASPGRPVRPHLAPGPTNPDGVFKYLRFSNEIDERTGAADLVSSLVNRGLAPHEIAVLMRSDYLQSWSKPLRDAIAGRGIPATDVEAALDPLGTDDARRLLALARLVADSQDSLAWWAWLQLTKGVSGDYIRAVANEAGMSAETFAARLVRISEERPHGSSPASHGRAVTEVERLLSVLAEVKPEGVADFEDGWAGWLLELARTLGIGVSEELEEIIRIASAKIRPDDGLGYFLSQLEPVTADAALSREGVSIMTMTRSKGLTFRAVIVLGVEKGVVPRVTAHDPEEERRILYVAITRAKEFCFLTMAGYRMGPTARTGQTNVGGSRGRCPFFEPLGSPFIPEDGSAYVRAFTEGIRR